MVAATHKITHDWHYLQPRVCATSVILKMLRMLGLGFVALLPEQHIPHISAFHILHLCVERNKSPSEFCKQF
jgi:hypothetical protein